MSSSRLRLRGLIAVSEDQPGLPEPVLHAGAYFRISAATLKKMWCFHQGWMTALDRFIWR